MQPNSSAVQPRAWYNALPRAQYASLQRVPVGQAWFEVYRLPGDVYALYESAHFQEVISFLILGRGAALLWDTGMGVGDMRALVRQLTDLPLVVLNSHCHFDHVGGNWQFDTVYACDCAASLAVLRAGQPNAQVDVHMMGEAACRPYPAGFDAQGYAIQPCNPHPVADGHVFDLGGRRMRVLYTPGHSPDSIMLLDEGQGCLYTGDTLYPATLYAHLHMPGGIRSDIRQYARTLRIL